MDRDFFLPPALEVAPHLLGVRLMLTTETGTVGVRITEVEAYHGLGTPGIYDGGSHSRDRRTDRNASMFGPPGHAYVYLSYGVHFALNLVCGPEGTASGVLLRAGEVIEGESLARVRRSQKRQSHTAHTALAKGPGNLAQALGITRPEHNGRDLFAPPFQLELTSGSSGETRAPAIARGPRVGVSGEAGGSAFPWRFWIDGDPTVSAYRPGRNVPTA